MSERDVESITSPSEFVATLRRLADALETGTSFRIQIAGQRFRVPKDAELSIEHERDATSEEVELQLRWPVQSASEHDEVSTGDRQHDDEDDDTVIV